MSSFLDQQAVGAGRFQDAKNPAPVSKDGIKHSVVPPQFACDSQAQASTGTGSFQRKTPIHLRCNGRTHHSLGKAAGPCVRYAAPRCYSTSYRNFVLRSRLSRCKTKYLFLYPFSAAGILCNISRYLLVLFTALSGMIVAWFFFAVNTELWVRTVRCSIAVL